MRAAMATVWAILKKDFVVELRTREVVASMVLFALLVVVIFAFAFSIGGDIVQEAGPGILWVTLVFAGNLGVDRVFQNERAQGCMSGLLMSPGGPIAVYFAKALGIFAFIVFMEALIVPLALIFVGITVPADGVGTLVGALALGALGFALIGTLFGATLGHVRLREVLIPLIVYPIVIPVLVAGVELTASALGEGIAGEAVDWFRLMVLFDLVFLALAPWVFARVMVD